jgi:NAD(P)-dependent dehydrogenase (short-subunit alcohol dehydrogenase family)
MFSIKNKVIVVTGGNGLLGRKMVNTLREQGAKVIAADVFFEQDRNDNLIMDITKEISVKKGIKTLVKEHKKIDGWVNNAYPRTNDWGDKFENIRLESWRSNVDMHLNGYFICSKHILEQMKVQEFGSLINMSSIYGLLGPDFTIYEGTKMTMPAAYSAIKGGITNLTRYLASYYGASNIRVNTLSPGGIFNNQTETFVSKYKNKVPLGRMGTTKDVCGAVYFLLSDEASYITGHNLVIDGGWSII